MKIQCRTLFDCSYTGVTGHFRASQLPFEDRNGRTINNNADWNYARNQQRNWETIMQMISLRTQPNITKYPQQVGDSWEFDFEIETPGVYSINGDVKNLDGLLAECEGVPMVTGLNENKYVQTCLITNGENQNIWFETVNN